MHSQTSVLATIALLSVPVAVWAITQPGFSIELSRTEKGIVATCEGCAWKRVTAESPAGFYRITDPGIEPLSYLSPEYAQPSRTPTKLSFILTTAGEGIAAKCIEGCAWKDLTAFSAKGSYQISERGIKMRSE